MRMKIRKENKMDAKLLTMDAERFYINGEPFDLASGDFHYFRTMPGGWRH